MIGVATDNSSTKRYILVVSSITYAYKAKDFLFNKGIRSYIDRIPAHLRNSGCGYGVRVVGDVDTVVSLLENEGINVKNIITI